MLVFYKYRKNAKSNIQNSKEKIWNILYKHAETAICNKGYSTCTWGGTTYAKSPPNLMVEMVPILMGKDVVSFQ